jgi:RNA polymerase sigma factor (sigma-70 family)
LTDAEVPVPPSASETASDLDDMLVRHLPDLQRAIRSLARRHHLSAEEERDLRGEVLVRLMAHGYAALRNYRGQSAMTTYLRVVAYRVLLDHRSRRWGKWRPSRRALAHGPGGVRFERMVGRDGLSIGEALSALRERTAGTLDVGIAHAIAARATRARRAREVPLELAAEAAVDPSQERGLQARDLTRYAASVTAVIRGALQELSVEDYRMLHRRFVAGESVAELARQSGADQKRLYRRQARILRRLRADLSRARLAGEELAALIGNPDVQLPQVFDQPLSA